jgi:hypothetical protein
MTACDFTGLIANTKSLLSGLTSWQSICGVATTAEAALCIYEYGVDEPEDGSTLCPLIILDVDNDSLEWVGGHLNGPVTVTVRMELAVPEIHQETYAKQAVWFWDQMTAVLNQVNSAANEAGTLMLERVTMLVKPGRIDPDENSGRTEWMVMWGFEVHLQ